MGATNSGSICRGTDCVGVSTAPAIRVHALGATRLILIPCGWPATVRLRLIPMTAALAVA